MENNEGPNSSCKSEHSIPALRRSTSSTNLTVPHNSPIRPDPHQTSLSAGKYVTTPPNSIANESSGADSDSDSFFTPTLNKYVENAFPETMQKFRASVLQTTRKLRMLKSISEVQNFPENFPNFSQKLVEEKSRKLNLLLANLRRRTDSNRTYYLLLFELEFFLETTPATLIISDGNLCDKLCHLLCAWLGSPTLDSKKFRKITTFLKAYYENGLPSEAQSQAEKFNLDPDFDDILKAWKRSRFFTTDALLKIERKRDFLGAFYFDILTSKFDEALQDAAYPLQSILDLGMQNIEFFHEFLQEFEIPFSGPYQKPDSRFPRIIYFVSSCNPSDSIINSQMPLYGAFEFKLNSLQLTSEEAMEFWENLSTAPSWLTHFPPLFNLALDPIRRLLF